jgi:dipeptidyl aminopeptidase/acylaminoacyl peptidase
MVCIFCVVKLHCASAALQDQQTNSQATSEPLTVAESSKFTSTSTSQEVEQFIDQCVERAPHLKKFVFGQSVESRDLVGVCIADEHYALGDQEDGRNVVLVVGNIHPGECSGKEGLLMLLRELAFRPNQKWLEQNVIILVPNYNPDANDRTGLFNRPGQLGPDRGMGRRENAQELDLNRDFGKLEAPETRALVSLINQVKPAVFVDCHTTNGSRHRYPLTYDIPHNPATSAVLRDYMRNEMMPAITQAMESKGHSTFYYGNFNRDQTQWFSFGHEPRYSTEYAGLRGILAVLVEDYAYLGYRERVQVSKEFVASIFDFATDHAEEIKQKLSLIRDEWQQTISTQPYRIELPLSAKPTPFKQKVKLKGYHGDQPVDLECEHVANYVSTRTTKMPYAYVIPQEQIRVIDRLKLHGIELLPISTPLKTDIEVDQVVEINELPIEFQKHRNRLLKVKRRSEPGGIAYGELVVHVEQPLGRLAAYLLESESDDGWAYWNFLDKHLALNSDYPIIRIPEPLEIQTDPSIEPAAGIQLSLDDIDGPQALLKPPTAPTTWFGKTNLINANFAQRKMLLDARWASFAERPAPTFDIAKLQALLTEKGVEESQAIALASQTPLTTVNGEVVVLADGKRSFVHWTKAPDAETSLMELGSPEPNGEAPSADNSPDQPVAQGPGELFDFNRDESKLAFVTATGLHVLDLETRGLHSVDAPSAQHLVGKLDWVYQEELYGRGNFKGYWWNPNGDEVAFLCLDESRVPSFTVMDHLPIRGKAEVTNYPKAGEPLPIVKVGVANAADGFETTWLELPDYKPDDLLISRVSWSQNGDVLLVQIQNREQTWLDLVAANRDGSNVRVLFRDQTPAWIESPGDPVFVSETEFLWLSPRDGIRRIYRHDLTGRVVATLTKQDWEVRELIGIDPEARFAYFMGAENPNEMHGFRLSLTDGQITKITEGAGTHQISFSHDYSLFLDRFSDVRFPTETRVCDASGQILRKLDVRSDDRLEFLNIATPEFTNIELGDGKKLDAMLIKPVNFSQYIRYPVLLHVYAGPQTPRVRNRFDGAIYLWHQLLAQHGYVVAVVDPRSSSFRNSKEAWPIHKQLAKCEMEDLEAAAQWLKRQSWVEPDRIGIWGWSYGGYMTLYALTHSKAFKMGISGAPVTDWKNYDAIYTERYMGLPQDNPLGYSESSILAKAHQLHGRLLLIHGTIDDNVHLNNSLQFVKQLQDAGVQFDLMLYPANRHAVGQPKQAAHLRKLMTDYILKHL